MYCLSEFCCICLHNKDLRQVSCLDNSGLSYHFKLTTSVRGLCVDGINDQRLICAQCCIDVDFVYEFHKKCIRGGTRLADYTSMLLAHSTVQGSITIHLIDVIKYNVKTEQVFPECAVTEVKDDFRERSTEETCLNKHYVYLHNNYDDTITEEYVNDTSPKLEDECYSDNVRDSCDFALKYFDGSINNKVTNNDSHEASTTLTENVSSFNEIKTEAIANEESSTEHMQVDSPTVEQCEDTPVLNETIVNEIFEEKYIPTEQLEYNQFEFETTSINTHVRGKQYECNICSKTFSSNSDLNVHTRQHSGTKLYACSYCDKKYNLQIKLSVHTKTHTEPKPHVCDTCGKKFGKKSYLKTHMRIHTGERPYECGVCGKRFRVNGNFQTHVRIHTGVKLYGCNICGHRFITNCNLQSHMRVHTGEKPYSCSICGIRFYHNSHLHSHMRVHTGDKPYVCGVCGKKFNHNCSLKRHKMTHTGERPYPCHICTKKFTQSSTLKKHLRLHEKQDMKVNNT